MSVYHENYEQLPDVQGMGHVRMYEKAGISENLVLKDAIEHINNNQNFLALHAKNLVNLASVVKL